MAFQKLAKRVELHANVAKAFADLMATDLDGSHAAGFARAFHAASQGPGDAHAPAYEPHGDLSPAASWRGGPPGAASLLEMASELIEHPLSISKREAFEQGLHEQSRVVQELLEKDTGRLPGNSDGYADMLQLLAEQPLDVRTRLLQVYNKLRPAMAILQRSEGFDTPPLPKLEEKASAEFLEPAAAKYKPEPALAAIIHELVAGSLAEYVQPVMESVNEELKSLKDQVAKGSPAVASDVDVKIEETTKTKQEETLLATIAELKGQLESSRAQHAESSGDVLSMVKELRAENDKLKGSLAATIRKLDFMDTVASEQPASSSPADAGVYRKLSELEGKLSEAKEGSKAYVDGLRGELDRLSAENYRVRGELATLHAAAEGSRLNGREPGHSKYKGSPLEMPPGAPPVSDWGLSPTTKGLERAKQPDFAGAWASVPPAESKAARKQLVESLAPNSLISDLPAMGDVSSYMLMRGPMLENWYLFKEFVNAGGDGETALLRALVKCANTRHKTCGKQEGQWRGLMEATSVLAYLEGLDGMYVDRTHTAVEREWEDARANAQNVLDYYLRLRHLLKNDDACSRGYNLILSYLREKKDRLAFKCLQECDAYDHRSWHAALDSLRSVDEQFETNSDAVPRAGAAGASRKGLLGLSGSKTTTKTTADDQKYTAGQLSFDTDITWEEATTLVQTLKALQDAQSKNEQSMADVQRKLAAMAPAANTPSAFASPNDRFKLFAPSSMGGPPKVYDLGKIYSFLNLKAPVPARKGGNPGFTHGAECAVCSEFLGFTEFVAYDQLKGLGGNSGARAFHNAWKCSKIPAAVKAQADRAGTAPAEVDELLKPIDDPHWKPRGA